MIESGVTFDFGQLVMDDEIAAMIKHVVGGIPVNDETMAVDDIAAVGAFGDFLSLGSTLRHMREQSQPRLMDRRVREEWESRGAEDLAARARAKAVELVETHQVQPLDPDMLAELDAIVATADRERGVG